MKIMLKGTRPSKIYVKGTIQLFWILKGHFMKIKVKGTRPSKINVKGSIQLFWISKGHFHENHAKWDQTFKNQC